MTLSLLLLLILFAQQLRSYFRKLISFPSPDLSLISIQFNFPTKKSNFCLFFSTLSSFVYPIFSVRTSMTFLKFLFSVRFRTIKKRKPSLSDNVNLRQFYYLNFRCLWFTLYFLVQQNGRLHTNLKSEKKKEVKVPNFQEGSNRLNEEDAYPPHTHGPCSLSLAQRRSER